MIRCITLGWHVVAGKHSGAKGRPARGFRWAVVQPERPAGLCTFSWFQWKVSDSSPSPWSPGLLGRPRFSHTHAQPFSSKEIRQRRCANASHITFAASGLGRLGGARAGVRKCQTM